MSDAPKSFPLPLWREPGVNYYQGVCLASLGLVFLVLNDRELSPFWSLLPVLAGLLGVATGWGRSPLLFLALLGLAVSVGLNRVMLLRQGDGLRIPDLLLCTGALGYVMGHYRLQCLLKQLFPTVGRMGQEASTALERGKELPPPRRAAKSVTTAEIGRFVLLLPAWAGVAQVVAILLPTDWGNPGIRPPVWRAMTLLWALAVAVLLLSSFLDQWNRRHMTTAEATLYLQDEAWHETRGEQRRAQRWAAWNRLGARLSIIGWIRELLLFGFLLLAIIYLLYVTLYFVVMQGS